MSSGLMPAKARFSQRLGDDFYVAVQADIRRRMADNGIDLLILDHPEDVAYVAGFSYRPNERPVVLALTADDAHLLVPELEREYAAHQAIKAETVTYFEYPGVDRPFAALARRIGSPRGRAAFPPLMAHRRTGELAAAFPNTEWVATDLVEQARMLKHPAEIRLHREAGRISDSMVQSGVDLVREALKAGRRLPSEIELDRHVVTHALSLMRDEHEHLFLVPMMAGALVYGGPNSAFPHAIASNRPLEVGDSFMLSLGCSVGGRKSESERTFVIGEPTAQQAKLYETMRDAQHRGTEAMRPGALCRDPNAVALAILRDAGFGDYIRHRLGHGMGVAFYEPPWVEGGDDTPIAAGMVLSSEPALYVPGLGGFRIADTVAITDTGPDRLTHFPRALADVIIS